eukprot:9692263-Alexandrium_andersonii.AAC.1
MLRFRKGGLRIGADCGAEEHWAGCGLHFGHPAMYRCQFPHRHREIGLPSCRVLRSLTPRSLRHGPLAARASQPLAA